MAWGLLEDEDQLKLDPAVAEFVRQRTGQAPAAPPVETAPDAAPFPAAGPSPQDAAAMAELEKLAAKDERTQGLGYLGGLLSDAGALMRGKDRGFRAPPQVDDSIRKFIISRKMGAGGAGAKPGSSAVTDAEVEALVAAGVPRAAAQAARVDPPTFRKLYEKHYEPRKADEMPPNLAADPDITARGEKVGIKQQTLEKPADFRNRVLAAEESKAGGATKLTEGQTKAAMDLRKEFNSLPEVQKFTAASTLKKKVDATSPNGVGDISLVYAFMTILDPGSSVKEGEVKMAADASPAARRAGNVLQLLINGGKIDQATRDEFKAEAIKIYEAQREEYQNAEDHYAKIANSFGIDPSLVIRKRGLPKPQARPGDKYLGGE